MARSPSTTPRHRWSPVVQVGLVLLGFVLLLWGGDALARYGAETLVARTVQDATGSDERPEVQVTGAFFLPQVIRGAYEEVDVTTVNLTSGPLTVARVDSQLFDVRVPFHDVLVRDIREIGIGRSLEELELTYDDLNAYLESTGRPVKVNSAGGGNVALTGSLDVLGQHVEANAEVSLGVDDGLLQVTPVKIDTGNTALSEASRVLLGQRLTFTIPMANLPFGHQLTAVNPDSRSIRATAEGRNVVVQP